MIKTKMILKILVIFAVSVTLPISQAHAVIPDSHLAMDDVVESVNGQGAHQSQNGDDPETGSPSTDPVPTSVEIPNDALEEHSLQSGDVEPLSSDQLAVNDQQSFWTQKKTMITTSIVLTTALLVGLLLLLVGAGGGDGGSSGGAVSGGGGGGGGGNSDPLKHNPEPSTLILMGLGLLLPFIRRKM